MKTLYRIWSEYDIGHENVVFDTEEDALAWAKNAYNYIVETSGGDETFEELVEGGLIETIEVIYYMRGLKSFL